MKKLVRKQPFASWPDALSLRTDDAGETFPAAAKRGARPARALLKRAPITRSSRHCGGGQARSAPGEGVA